MDPVSNDGYGQIDAEADVPTPDIPDARGEAPTGARAEKLAMSVIPTSAVRSYTRVATVVTVMVTPLAALSYFATKDGAESYDVSTTKAWARPARDLLEPLLTFGSADRVYATYTLILAVLLPALPLAVWVVRAARAGIAAPGERRVSWVVGAAWTAFAAGLAVVAVALQVKPSDTGGASVVNIAFMSAVFPGLVIGMFSSLALGIVYLRAGFVPRWPAVVVLLALPIWIVGSAVLGHNSIGIAPQLVAWTFAVGAVVPAEASRRTVGV